MDFFEAQDEARRRTFVLVGLFVLAVLALMGMANLVVMVAVEWWHRTTGPNVAALAPLAPFAPRFDANLFVAVSAGVLAVVGAGTYYKLSVLSGGGKVVAESLGGTPVARDTVDPLERRLLNVVDEMAIAAGTPVPPVYVLTHEKGVNAFAAGLDPGDAVIAVTRGAIVQLDRDQLQGVIGHEFSHILRGDMRLNVRLMGMIHGILMLGLIGQFLLRSMRFGGRRGPRGGVPVFALGAGLMVVGYGGTFFGNLIKSAVGRQREYLADAGSVQFTRNPLGIAGALKRIGGLMWGFRVMSPAAPEASHMLFGPGVEPIMGFLFDTHPPLKERIRRLDRRWDGRFDDRPAQVDPDEGGQLPPGEEGRQVRRVMGAMVATATTADAIGQVARIGAPDETHIAQAQAILGQIPEEIRRATSDPYGARAVIYALLCDHDAGVQGGVLERQLGRLDAHADSGVAELTRRLRPEAQKLDARLRLPVVDLCLPALKSLSVPQLKMFGGNLVALMHADARLSLFEWCLARVVRHHLARARHPKPPMREDSLHISLAVEACQVLLSALAWADAPTPEVAHAALSEAQRYLMLPGVTLLGPETDLKALDGALARLASLGPLHKRRLLKACIACIHADGKVSAEQAELLRAVSDALDCPMPPPVG
jgi:Zn-dependent protease with chaperone function